MSAMPILLVPGLLCTAEVFADQIVRLWKYGPITIGSTLEGDNVAAIASHILEMAPPRFALAGISMGGYISLEIMRQAPGRITGLALIDTTARPDSEEKSAERRALLAEATEGEFDSVAFKSLQDLLHPSRRNNSALRAINARMAATVGLAGFERQLQAIISRPDSRPSLSGIIVPTHVIVGDADKLTPVDQAMEIASLIPNAEISVIPNCGHLSTIEQPKLVSDCLTKWIEALGVE